MHTDTKPINYHECEDYLVPGYRCGVNFARECFGKIRKYYVKDPLLLKQQLAKTIRAWLKSGLKQEILEKIKETVIAHFEPIKIKE